MDLLTKGFTIVTDNASVMARVARASVSARLAPLTAKWMGCMVHQINIALKCCITALANDEELSQISDDLQSVKKIVIIFKQSNWNCLLPDAFRLVQEVETRFGTTYQVLSRFLKSSALVEQIISGKDSAPAKSAFENLRKTFGPAGHVTFHALEVVVDAFADVIELQTALQASKQPTIHTALPKLRRCRDKLQCIADGGSVSRGGEIGFIPAPPLSRSICKSTIEWLDAKVRIHPLIMAGCFMNPLFREFQFLEDPNKRRSYRDGGEAMVRSLMSNGNDRESSTTANTAATANCGASVYTLESDDQPAVAGRKRTYSMLEYADSHFQSFNGADEVSRYNAMDIGQLAIDRNKYMKDPFSPISFWYMHRSAFPSLYRVALRLFSIPVSSCASERVFSALNRIASRDRARLNPSTLEEIIVVRSLLSDE